MKPLKMLHTSDLHIDWPFEKFAAEQRQQRRRDLFGAFEYLCQLAISIKVDVLLIAGDLFHSDRVDRHTVSLVVSGFTRLMEKGIQVVILPGNHDMEIAGLLGKNGGMTPNVFVFSGQDWQEYSLGEGVTFYGHPFCDSRKNERVLPRLNVGGHKGFAVGVLHGTVSALPDSDDSYFPITGDDISSSGLDYLALGHFHNLRDCSRGNTVCFYPGSPERLSFANISERQAVIVTLQDDKVSAVPVNIPARPYKIIELGLGEMEPADIYARISSESDTDAVARLTLNGIISAEDLMVAENVEQYFKHSFFHLEVFDKTRLLPGIDPSDKTVKGIFVAKLMAKMDNQDLTEEEKAIFMEALKAGLTAMEGGKL